MASSALSSSASGPAGAEPRFGAGAGDDPGFLRSLRGGTLLGRLRRAMAGLALAPVLILAIVPFIVREGRGRLGGVPVWVYLPIVVVFLVTAVIVPRVPRPMPVGLPPLRAAATAMLALRQAIFLRFALCEAVIILGLPLAIVSHSEVPFLVGFALGYPTLLLFVVPTTGLVERIRRRLEADGAQSHLWAILMSEPGPSEGPAAGSGPGRETP